MIKPDREEALNKIKSSKAIESWSSHSKLVVVACCIYIPACSAPNKVNVGLNPTCNNLILVDLWWNPALEGQAFDRARRLGQRRDANICKLSIPGTAEERTLEVCSGFDFSCQSLLTSDVSSAAREEARAGCRWLVW